MIHESHIFIGHVDPDGESIERFKKVVKLFNETFHGDFLLEEGPMQGSVMYLNHDQKKCETVMQSSLYIKSNNMKEVIDTTHQLANNFCMAELTVIREKIIATDTKGYECISFDNNTIKNLGKYYDFRIKVPNIM